MEDGQVGNRKSQRPIDKYPDKQHHGIKRFNLCRSKISLRKNRGSSEDHRKNVKTRMGTQIRIADKKIRQQAKILKRNRCRDRTKQYEQKQRKKILQTRRGKISKHMPTTRSERGKNILEQNVGTKRS